MSLSKDNRSRKPTRQTRTQKIVMWSIFGIAGVMLVVAIILFARSGASLF